MGIKDGKIAQQIIEQQNDDGTWGYQFHSLAIPNGKKPLMTEQSLRRLKILGFSINDEPIHKCVDTMLSCLKGERKIDNYWEKGHDWDLFTRMMLSTWVKIFEPSNEISLSFAKLWSKVIVKSFADGTYNEDIYKKTYREVFGYEPNAAREMDFVHFYIISLLQDVLPKETEGAFLDYVINYEKGIYYVYNKPISMLPNVFASRETSHYLAAVELLSGYEAAKEKLGFVADWLEENKGEDGRWDLGSEARDNLYFPLSDSWRKKEDRKDDCTKRISDIMRILKS